MKAYRNVSHCLLYTSVDKNGRSVEIDVQALPEEYKHLAEEIKDVSALKAVLGSAYVDGMEVIDVRDVVIVGDASLVEFPLTITFKVPGVLSTTKVAVLHYVDGAWQVEPSKAGNGTITATFDSLSPVAFVAVSYTHLKQISLYLSGKMRGTAGDEFRGWENRRIFKYAWRE